MCQSGVPGQGLPPKPRLVGGQRRTMGERSDELPEDAWREITVAGGSLYHCCNNGAENVQISVQLEVTIWSRIRFKRGFRHIVSVSSARIPNSCWPASCDNSRGNEVDHR